MVVNSCQELSRYTGPHTWTDWHSSFQPENTGVVPAGEAVQTTSTHMMTVKSFDWTQVHLNHHEPRPWCTYTTHAHTYDCILYIAQVYTLTHWTYHLPKATFDALAPILEALTLAIFTTCIPAAHWAVVHFFRVVAGPAFGHMTSPSARRPSGSRSA